MSSYSLHLKLSTTLKPPCLQQALEGILGDDLFPRRLMFVQAVITPTPCVKEICCFATLAGCKSLTPSFCGWKTLRRFFEEREVNIQCWPFVFLSNLQRVCSLNRVPNASG